MLSGGFVSPRILPMLKKLGNRRPDSRPGSAQRVGGTGLGQGFEYTAVQIFWLDGFYKLESVLETPFLGAGGADFAGRAFANVLDGGKAETNLFADRRE